jgi:predicted membrane protein
MNTFLKFPRLLWVDAGGALVSCGIAWVLKTWGAALLGLPEQLLGTLAVIGLCFAVFSSILAVRQTRSRSYLSFLVGANFFYATVCAVLAVMLFNTASWLGVVYLCCDALIVAGVAAWEWRQIVVGRQEGAIA